MILGLRDYAIVGLAIGLALSGMGNYALWQRAKAADATAQPLRDAATSAAALADGYQTALQTCENEKVAMREDNAKALREAEEERLLAEQRAEEYQRLLANPPLDCQAVLDMQLCPALLGY